jgi:hypothetical protein
MVSAYACRLRGSEHETVINSTSPGRAKREFLLDLDMGGVEYTDIRVRRVGGPVTTDGIKRVAEHRGVPFAKAGMRVIVSGEPGRIVGHNSSGNFDVLFDEGSKWAGNVINSHPNWEIVYLDDDGTVLADFRQKREAAVTAGDGHE